MNDHNPKCEPIPPVNPESRWTELKNHRRCELIDKDIAGTLSEAERAELQNLQHEVDTHLQRVAPRPLEELEKLKRKLQQSVRDAKAS